ncbi:MAG TPA: DNA translocase FtsK, partial [Saprospiraceae bacterium]|nr:DNA translocase FtsK [Saprospiraceae bacterium]
SLLIIMARSKKSKASAWDSFVLWLKDERLSKILAILCFTIALFLLISSISYFFSWKADQDKVLSYSWRILFQSKIEITNWLGKLGALTSHLLFYYGFGVAAILFIPVLIHLGFRFLHRGGWLSFLRFTTHSMVIMSLLSMIFYYIFQNLQFPFGGAFGARNCLWIEGFMGPIGAGLSLMFGLVALLVWYYNPSMQTLQVDAMGPRTATQFWHGDWFRFGGASAETAETADRPAPEQFLKTTPNPTPQQKPIQVDWSDYPDPDILTASLAPEPSSAGHFAELEIEDETTAPGLNPFAQNIEQSADLCFPPAVDEPEDGWEMEPGTGYDPKANLSAYKAPTLDLLNDYADQKFEIDRDELETNKNLIIATLLHYKIEIQKIKATIGPTVTLYEIVPAPGVRISKIKNLEDDIALSLSAQGIRIIAPIPGKGTIGIEVANKNRQTVPLKELLRSERFNDPKLELPIALGKNISNEVIVADLTKMPHLLIAGATGQGKSVGINAILMSLLYRKHPAEVKLVLIDPKKVELPIYSEIRKHFLAQLPNSDESIITDNSKVIYTLNSLCIEMDQRYELLKGARVRNILEYNDKFTRRKLNPENGHRYLPYIVLVIDEFADLIMTAGKEVEMPIGRLAQLARAVGMHLIIATQRPSVKIITGLIKANFPGRIAFKVSSNVDSRTILDYGGAERLIGRGDMLYSVGSDMIRLQCAFVDTPEVERVIKHIGNQQSYGAPYFLPEYKGDESENGGAIDLGDLDEMLTEAARLVVQSQHGSTSMIQRRLKLGYNRAGRIMDQLEQLGIVSAGEGSKPREVLVFSEVELENVLTRLKKS